MLILYLMSFLEILNLAFFIPTFAPYIKSNGGSNTYIGIISSTASLLGLFWNPIIGSLSDSTGQKSAAIKCLTLGLLGKLLMCIYPSIYTIFASQIICALATPVIGLLRTITNDVIKNPEERSAFNSKNGIILGVGFMGGAYFGGYISELKNGFYYNFVISAICMFTELVLAYQLPETVTQKKKKDETSQSPLNSLKKAVENLKNVNWKKYSVNLSIKACIDVCYTAIQSSVGLVLATKFGAKGRVIASVFIVISICGIITNVLMLKLKGLLYKDDVGFKRIEHGAVMLTLVFIGFYVSPTLYIFTAFVGLMSVSRTMLDNSMVEALSSATTKDDQGSVMSAFETLTQLAGFVIPVTCGLITDTIDEKLPFLLCIAPAAYAVYKAHQQKPKTE